MSKNRIGIAFVLFVLLTAVIITACSPTIEERTVEVTRLVTETVEVGGDIIEVTRIVTETVPATPVPTTETPVNKDLVVCMAQEPDTMYIYGGTMLAARHVQHAVFENDITLLSYDYQAQGIEKLPSLADGDAFIEEVEVNAGDLVLDSSGNPVTLEEGVEVSNAAGEAVVFDGTPIMMQQLVTDFTMKPRVWSDGTPVTTDDSVFSFELTNDPDTPSTKFLNDRTASYETTG